MIPADTHCNNQIELRAYLAALFGSEHGEALIEVRCPRRARLRRFFPTGEIDKAAAHITRWATITDVYVGVAPRHRTEGRQSGGKEAIQHVQALWADCDSGESVAALVGFEPPTTMEVSSGGGVYAYWLLTTPVTKEQAERGNRRLALALGGDPAATDAARILRPPGSFNHKPQRMLDGKPAPVSLQALRETRHAWKEIVGSLPDPATPRPKATGTVLRSVGDDSLLAISPPYYVRRLAGREVGRDGKALCPFHPDRNPSLHAYPDPEAGWYCYGCGRGGGIIEFGALLFDIEPRGAGYRHLRQLIASRLVGEGS